MAGAEAYLEVLQAVPDACECVMVVGHNPGLEELVEVLTGEAEPCPPRPWPRSRSRFRAGETSGDIEGELVHLWRPRELRGE